LMRVGRQSVKQKLYSRDEARNHLRRCGKCGRVELVGN